MNLPDTSTASDSNPAAAPTQLPERNPLVGKIAAGLALATFVIFLPVVSMDWVNYDDDVFVTNNTKVAPGFTWEGVKWAFSSADIDYWRPLSWLSHMLDIELYGAVAMGHHLSSLLIHCAAVVMAFLALHRLTKEVWTSAMVAALFAWHPLHVESVAWIAERKDVLCGLFWFFTIWGYARYVERPSLGRYLVALGGFMLGIMSKPMVVTLPCVLILLDWWPLRRPPFPCGSAGAEQSWAQFYRLGFRLLVEKIPFFALVALLSVSTLIAQHSVGTMSSLDRVPLALRFHNCLNSYATYIYQMVWPSNLCVLYPYGLISTWRWVSAGVILSLISLFCWRQRQQRPYLLVGWLWYLGTLVPVIGLLQVGEQAHADRYTYLPLVGLFLMLVWWVQHWNFSLNRSIARGLAIGWLVGLALVSQAEMLHWENTITLFQRAVDVTRNNYTALSNLGAGLFINGRTKEAIQRQHESLAVHPTEVAYVNLFLAYYQLGQHDPALAALNRAFLLSPSGQHTSDILQALNKAVSRLEDRALALKAIALAHTARGELSEAARHLTLAVQERPQDPLLRIDLAANFSNRGLDAEAIDNLRAAITLQPTNAIALSNLGALLAKQGQLTNAIALYRDSLRHSPSNPHTRYNLALALIRVRELPQARQEFESVLATEPSHLPAARQLVWILSTDSNLRDGAAALKVAAASWAAAGRSATASLMDITAAAHAAAGDYPTAVSVAKAAQAEAERSGQPAYAKIIRQRIELYQRRFPYERSTGEIAPQ